MKAVAPAERMGKSAGAYPVPNGGAAEAAAKRPREKIADVADIERALQLAAVTLKPDELSGRQLINRLMPQLFVLRKKGFSFVQLTRVLNSAIENPATKLQVATVKAYYNEFIIERMDECENNLKTALEVQRQVEQTVRVKSAETLVADAIEMKKATMTAAGGHQGGAISRMLAGAGAQNGARPSPVEPAKAAPPSPPEASTAAEKTPRQTHASAAAAPSAPGITARMGRGSVDDIPIPALPGGAADEGGEPEAPPVAVPAEPVVKAVVPPAAKADGSKAVLVCTTIPTADTLRPTTADTYTGVPQEFFSTAILEHPAIPGLMLTAEQRRYSKRLEYTADGVPTLETVQQMPNRFRWKKPATRTPSRTESTFVPMNEALFRKQEDRPSSSD